MVNNKNSPPFKEPALPVSREYPRNEGEVVAILSSILF